MSVINFTINLDLREDVINNRVCCQKNDEKQQQEYQNRGIKLANHP